MRKYIPTIAITIALCGTLCIALAAAPATQPIPEPAAEYSSPPLPAADPAVFHEPAEMPTLLNPLSDVDYEKQAAALHLPDAFDVAEAKARPVLGLVISRIGRDSPAAAAGLKVGDLIAAIDGEPARFYWDMDQLTRSHDEVTMAIVTPGKPPRRARVMTHRMDLMVDSRWDAAAAWALSPARDARFDSYIRVAGQTYNTDPTLALAALARAQKAGWNGKNAGYVPLTLASFCTYRQCYFDEMLPLGALAMKCIPATEKPLLLSRMKISAAASFKYQYWLDLEGQSPPELKEPELAGRVTEALDYWKKTPNHARPNPLGDLADFDFHATTDLTSLYSKQRDPGGSNWAANQLRKNGKFEASVPEAHFRLFAFGPTGNNVDASLAFSFKPDSEGPSDFGKDVCFSIVDENDNLSQIVKMVLFDNGNVMLDRQGATWYYMGPPKHDGPHHARMIVVDQRCEVILDGRRVFYAPIENPEHDRKLGFSIQLVGVKAKIDGFAWRTAGERKK